MSKSVDLEAFFLKKNLSCTFEAIWTIYIKFFGEYDPSIIFLSIINIMLVPKFFFYPKSLKKWKTRKGFSTQSFVCNMINIGTLLQMKWSCIVLNTCQIHLIVISRAKKSVIGRNGSVLGGHCEFAEPSWHGNVAGQSTEI